MSRTERLALGTAFALGVLVRVLPVVDAPLAVGDGGFILSMVDDVRRSWPALPTTTTYNGLDIPYVYPPAALWAAALLGELFQIGTMDLLHWAPLGISIATLLAFARLALRVVPKTAALAATFSFALMPAGYGWLVAGGGLTRGLGVFLALLAIGTAAARTESSTRRAAAAGALLGLSVLSHPQAAIFGVLACLIVTFRKPRSRWLKQAAAAGAVMVLVALPWLAWVATTNGLGSIVGAGHRLEPLVGLVRMLNLRFSGAPFMDVVGVAGAVGLLVSLLRREWRVPSMLLATSLAGAGGGEHLAATPWALLAGSTAVPVTESLWGRGAADRRPSPAYVALLVAGVLFLALIGAAGSVADRSSKLHPLAPEQVAAMTWLRDNVPADATVIVPTSEVWGEDEVSEWLPAIAVRRSLGTVQGSEWLGHEGYQRQLAAHQAILQCAGSDASCFRALNAAAVLFVPKGSLAGPFSPNDCCSALRSSLTEAGYTVIYDGPGATIAQHEP